MKLIPEWRSAWRFSSVQMLALLALLQGVRAEVLPLFQFALSERQMNWIVALLALLIMVLRVVSQNLPQAAAQQGVTQTIEVGVPEGMDPAEFAAAVARHSALLVDVIKRNGVAK